MMAKADVELSMLKTKDLNEKLKQLIREFKKFTLPNRNRLKEMEKKIANAPRISERTRRAIEGRRLNQEKAEALLQYQVSVVTLGLKTHHISDLWRERYGNDT
jgi:ribosomal protein L18E